MTMALSVARAMLLACTAIYVVALGAALLGAPFEPAWIVGMIAAFGLAVSALACLILQALRFFRYRRERSRHA